MAQRKTSVPVESKYPRLVGKFNDLRLVQRDEFRYALETLEHDAMGADKWLLVKSYDVSQYDTEDQLIVWIAALEDAKKQTEATAAT